MQSNTVKTILVGVGILVAVIIGLGAYVAYLTFAPTATDDTADIAMLVEDIVVIDPPLPLPDGTLVNERGETVNISDFAGEPILITFGFTHCPDVCPITLGEMRNIHAGLNNLADDINFIFVSVDGERDTPQVLDNYLTTLRVNEFVTALTGTQEDISEFVMPYGVEFIFGERDALGNYNVEHTAGMFLLNAEGEWVRRYRYNTPSGRIVNDLQDFLQG